MERALSQLRSKGLNLKVAIIGSSTDLGALTNAWQKPQMYAQFLGAEISFNQPQPLLTVMPAGFGVSHAGSSSALQGLGVDSTHHSNGLARSAILAVLRIAKTEGKPVSLPSIPTTAGGSGGGTSPLLTFGGPALLVLLAVAAGGLLRRRSAAAAARDNRGFRVGEE